MIFRKPLYSILRTVTLFPNHGIHKIAFAKNVIAYFFEISLLTIINANKNNPIICKQIFCNFQAWINHIEPVCMETTIALSIRHKAIAFFIILTAIIHIVRRTLGKIVLIDKIIAGVVRRVIYYLNPLWKSLCNTYLHTSNTRS